MNLPIFVPEQFPDIALWLHNSSFIATFSFDSSFASPCLPFPTSQQPPEQAKAPYTRIKSKKLAALLLLAALLSEQRSPAAASSSPRGSPPQGPAYKDQVQHAPAANNVSPPSVPLAEATPVNRFCQSKMKEGNESRQQRLLAMKKNGFNWNVNAFNCSSNNLVAVLQRSNG